MKKPSRSSQRQEKCSRRYRDLTLSRSRKCDNLSIFKIAEGGSPETPVPAAVNMAGNNNDYFYDQGRHQEEYDDDDFWGAPEPGR